MDERETRPSVNRKTVYAYLRQEIAHMESLDIIVEEYDEMVKDAQEKLGIFPAPIKPENIRLS
ncbi:hypothetical protein A2394_03015 [Candidatus Woesebacteria bacterium RIFOXYB1_FULL_42_36]|uniref:Uncharacterized protein n=1 Tax=Candidatus Woesebacteria bacterium RIFOXYD1_FULL_43_18 TaxID=1802551 RepID=A0A1F8DKH6_9BACT|nr:MAG: hypothetical protein A2208_01445 [Candidatus Woesebacteria bacterium RIFOXYA1_FULL_43_16]OGM81464.1 MAG: hypothetical protein A2394_03015 [Candidatus Woesebacteria bacterium RIFOXYB1_FULL_42_36]OGM84685.1 MAG: hypothetical protein A2421_03295 [Candidatus Woesebacteria bacterium RIFOXYC1_FULL_43_18]OGM88295.1 MAG: hypothetical protein A2573_02675 [Candidatus Woesebacteria bacterium RIFOXYD1_FULL_43_18]